MRLIHIQIARLTLAMLVAGLTGSAVALTSNGNDFALYFTEAPTDAETKALVEDALGRPHFFRYLQVMEMEETGTNGVDCLRITAFEPASYMDVCFDVTKQVSLRILREAPATRPGAAIAVTGKIASVDKAANTIHLNHVIVRHKDRLSPARGKELLCEVDSRSTFYSYTGGKQIVRLTYKDRDLLQFKDRILRERGNQGWADFLVAELKKRNATRGAAVTGKQAATEDKR